MLIHVTWMLAALALAVSFSVFSFHAVRHFLSAEARRLAHFERLTESFARAALASRPVHAATFGVAAVVGIQSLLAHEFPDEIGPQSELTDVLANAKKQSAALSGLQLSVIVDYDNRFVNVYYVTNRKIQRGKVPADEKVERSPVLSYGEAVVRIPEQRRVGSIEKPRTRMTWITGKGWVYYSDGDKNKFVLRTIRSLEADEFVRSIKSKAKKKAVLFVHGFNTPFKDALFTLAQLIWDFQGENIIPVVFSWPSAGEMTLTAYNFDQISARYSQDAFLKIVDTLNADAGVSDLNIIAHSMGNDLIVGALSKRRPSDMKVTISEIIMAAPDVDADIYEQGAPNLVALAGGVTNYASSNDWALWFSQYKAHDVRRAGYVNEKGPLLVERITTIDVSVMGDDPFGTNHSTFATNRAVIDDIGRVLRQSGLPPSDRLPPHDRSPGQIRRVPEGAPQPRYWTYAR